MKDEERDERSLHPSSFILHPLSSPAPTDGDPMRAAMRTLLLLAPLAACHAPQPFVGQSNTLDMTWSVVAADPATGDVGVAMASCVPGTLADALAALVPGKGAAATQAS